MISNGDSNENNETLTSEDTENKTDAITNDEKEKKNFEKIDEEDEEDKRSPTPEYTPPGSQVSLQNDEGKAGEIITSTVKRMIKNL